MLGCWLVACSLSLQAQPFDVLLPLEQGIAPDADVQLFTDAQQGMMFIREGTVGRVLILDESLHIKRRFRVDDLPSPDSYTHLGYTYQAGLLHLCLLDRTTGQYHVLTIYPDHGKLEQHLINMGRMRKDNVYWGTFSYEGSLHILRLPQGTETIRLCRFEGGETFSVKDFSVDQPAFLAAVSDEITRIDAEHPPTLDRVAPTAKLFHAAHDLYLSLDHAGKSYVIHINLLTQEKEEFTFPTGLPDARHNSCIHTDKLFQWAIRPDSLVLSIFDLSNQSLLRQYAYEPQELQTFWLDTPRQSLNQQPVETILDGHRYLTSLIDMPDLGVGVETLDSQHVKLTLGGIHVVEKKGIGGIVLDQSVTQLHATSLLTLPDFSLQSELPPTLANRRFPLNMMDQLPHFKRFTINGKRYYGYWDVEKEGYYLTQ